MYKRRFSSHLWIFPRPVLRAEHGTRKVPVLLEAVEQIAKRTVSYQPKHVVLYMKWKHVFAAPLSRAQQTELLLA